MAAPTVRQIRAGVKTRLDTISGLRVFDTVPGQFSPPAAIIGMPERPETETFGQGTDRWNLPIWIVVARQADAQSEKAIEDYLNPTGSSSVRAAIYGDKKLGATVSDTYELSGEVVDFRFGPSGQEVTYIGLEFNYRILAEGKA